MSSVESLALRTERAVLPLIGAAYLGAVLLAMALTSAPNGYACFWLANALALGLMLRRPGAATGIVFVAASARVLAGVALGEPAPLAFASTLITVAELTLVVYLVQRLALRPVGHDRLRDSLLTLALAGLLAPLLGGLLAALLQAWFAAATFTDVWRGWSLAGLTGATLVLPALLAYEAGDFSRLARPGERGRVALVAVASLLAGLASVTFLDHPFVVLSLALVYAALVFDRFAATLLGALTLLAVMILHAATASTGAHVIGAVAAGIGWLAYCAISAWPSLLVGIVERQRRSGQRALHDYQQRLQLVADKPLAMIGHVDGEGRIRFDNLAIKRWFGIAPAAMIGHDPREVFKHPAFAGIEALIPAAQAGQRLEISNVSDGRAYRISLIPDQAGGRAGGVYLLLIDVTEAMTLKDELFQERELAKATFGSIIDAVITTDVEGRIRFMNPVALAMTGWRLEDAIDRPLGQVMHLIDSETGEPNLPGQRPLEVAIRENRFIGLGADTTLVRRDGYLLPIEDSAAPIRNAAGAVVGGVMVFHDVSEIRAMAMTVSHLAQHDFLTDLPNRVLLHDRLNQVLAEIPERHSGALLFIDLDNFKNINDSLGHVVGDRVLMEVAQRLNDSVRNDDTVSRQGGDEFVIILPRLADLSDAARVAEKLLAAMMPPIVLDGHELVVSMSIGIALYPDDGDNADVLMKHADTALFQAKAAGRGRYQFFTQVMSARAERRLAIERDLRQALQNGDFVLHYQAKIGSADRAITGMEALVRWQATVEHLVHPGEFVAIAEECGLIDQIDSWALREACRQNKAWQDAGLPAIPVAVNVSLARFDGEQLLRLVADVLAETGLEPRFLDVEVTETQALHDTERTRLVMEGLKAMGVNVAMDDFGTGYSSLSYLQRFRFDVLKIDRSFINALASDSAQLAIVRAILAMSHALGYSVVAEGVETEAQAAILQANGCEEMQGYLFSRPVGADDFATLLALGIDTGP